MRELPFISCKTVTYGRVSLLEEAIESFLKQDYPKDKCELVIVNDYPRQNLIYDNVSNIHIYNLKETFNPIGAKENYATALCNGDIICQWDDDDIALPNHLKNVAKYFTDTTNILHWGHGMYYNEPDITDIVSVGNSGIVFRKSAWEAIGGHPLENAGYDMTFVIRLHQYASNGRVSALPPKEETSWMYRWSLPNANAYHQSGQGADTPDRPNIIERHFAHVEGLREKGLIPTGDIYLDPHWNYDYVELLKKFINNNK